MQDLYFMKKAYEEALKAEAINEVPIGSVIIYENEIIGAGFNERNTKKNALCHAEIAAINEACNFLKDWRLENCTIYVTLEPCPMCAGAILQARIKKLVFGAKSPKAGSIFSITSILENDLYNHKVEIVQGIMEKECSSLIENFFSRLRKGDK